MNSGKKWDFQPGSSEKSNKPSIKDLQNNPQEAPETKCTSPALQATLKCPKNPAEAPPTQTKK